MNKNIDKDVLEILNTITELEELKDNIENLLKKGKAVVRAVQPFNKKWNHLYLNKEQYPLGSKVILIKVE